MPNDVNPLNYIAVNLLGRGHDVYSGWLAAPVDSREVKFFVGGCTRSYFRKGGQRGREREAL